MNVRVVGEALSLEKMFSTHKKGDFFTSVSAAKSFSQKLGYHVSLCCILSVFSDSAFCRIYLFKITRDRQDHILYSKFN